MQELMDSVLSTVGDRVGAEFQLLPLCRWPRKGEGSPGQDMPLSCHWKTQEKSKRPYIPGASTPL